LAGPQGTPGFSGHQPVTGDNVAQTVNPGTSAWYVAVCPAGKRALGGGYEFLGGSGAQLTAIASHPSDASATGWRVQVRNNTGAPVTTTIRVHAVCAIVP
jgi:hypothetical protein